jgi:hypothetical protein
MSERVMSGKVVILPSEVEPFTQVAQFISIGRWLKLFCKEWLCTALKRAVSHAMGSKTMQRSPAFPPVLTSYKLLEIERLG